MNELRRYDNMLEIIGCTPMVRLNYLQDYTKAKVYAKLESFNPGLATKDRIVKYMVEKAEKEGKLKPGATIIEATSGNTGYALASICAMKGYKCILTMTDKIGKSKVDLIRAFGARIEICSAKVPGDHPDSYFSVAERLNKEIPNSYYLNQNHDPANSEAHYKFTGPEIWEQMEGEITHFFACSSTGGTISGTGKYLKEQNKDVEIICVDATGSLLRPYFETGKIDKSKIGSTQLEGVGKKIIPGTMDFSVIDDFVTVEDKESALSVYELAQREGLLMGYSSGAALQAIKQYADKLTENDTVVVLLADHGSKYLTKVYDSEWMKAQGFWQDGDDATSVQNKASHSSVSL